MTNKKMKKKVKRTRRRSKMNSNKIENKCINPLYKNKTAEVFTKIITNDIY